MSNQIDESYVRQNIPDTGDFEGSKEFLEPNNAYAQEPPNRSLALDGYLWWNNLSVSYEGGTRLLVDNQPLRASQVEFYIDDLSWQYALNGPRITDPWGNGQQAPGDWFVPGMLQFGIIIFQSNSWWGRVDRGINRKAIQRPGEDILFNVNDKRGTYGDNGGSFDLYLKVLS
ncbi:hypothetical protein [Lyngbya confervoides]|uniref:Uncharacterized protein n=1 Tax=Lyngbya confervoides BDU141951 TaxID=1574623 RepID=A0ABD4T409_9CYAN|nr:hypothetical protein [Lyngbya confervoides]MCM1983213.1 hypothetical protein [Lyngbya confervoides BDU141951]